MQKHIIKGKVSGLGIHLKNISRSGCAGIGCRTQDLGSRTAAVTVTLHDPVSLQLNNLVPIYCMEGGGHLCRTG